MPLIRLAPNVSAYIDGDKTDTDTEVIEAGSIALHASDDSVINNFAGAASAAVAVGQTGVAVSIGGAVAVNEITTTVDAHIDEMSDGISANETQVLIPAILDGTGAILIPATVKVIGDIIVHAEQNATITATSAAASIALGFGQVGVAVSGAGAGATNYILTSTNASISNSTILNADRNDIDALNTSTINATVVAASVAVGGGQVGVGASNRRINCSKLNRV